MSPTLSIRRPVILGLVATLALLMGFGLWATLTHISGAIVAQGQQLTHRCLQLCLVKKAGQLPTDNGQPALPGRVARGEQRGHVQAVMSPCPARGRRG